MVIYIKLPGGLLQPSEANSVKLALLFTMAAI